MTATFADIYSTGLITLTNGSSTFTGSGVLWSDIEQGDILVAQGLVAVIDSVSGIDFDAGTLQANWQGAGGSNLTYQIIKLGKGRFDPSLTQAKLRQMLAMLDNSGIIYSVLAGHEPDPAVGEDDQYALRINGGIWTIWLKVDGEWQLQGSPAGGLVYDVGGYSPDRPGSNENILSWLFNRTVVFPANFAGSRVKLETAPTADMLITIWKTLATVPAVVTITNASPGVVTHAAHGKVNGDRVKFSTTGALPAGLTAGAWYYIVNKATNTYQLAATPGGAAINTTSAGTGTHSASYSVLVGTLTVAAGATTTGTFASAETTFGPGDVLDANGPNPRDATAADVRLTFAGLRT